jgi:hypothetical protein
MTERTDFVQTSDTPMLDLFLQRMIHRQGITRMTEKEQEYFDKKHYKNN